MPTTVKSPSASGTIAAWFMRSSAMASGSRIGVLAMRHALFARVKTYRAPTLPVSVNLRRQPVPSAVALVDEDALVRADEGPVARERESAAEAGVACVGRGCRHVGPAAAPRVGALVEVHASDALRARRALRAAHRERVAVERDFVAKEARLLAEAEVGGRNLGRERHECPLLPYVGVPVEARRVDRAGASVAAAAVLLCRRSHGERLARQAHVLAKLTSQGRRADATVRVDVRCAVHGLARVVGLKERGVKVPFVQEDAADSAVVAVDARVATLS
eukprot:scaffold1527_cov143-Pinguiococcus_pyrenoidosus.AAC.5